MISHAAFGVLRLEQFLPDAEIAVLDGWEFMDAEWVGEAFGFSEWLRLANDPDVLRSVALDFSAMPREVADAVLGAIELPIRPGMSLEEIRGVLGNFVAEERYAADRESYDFVVHTADEYKVSCTLRRGVGLSYVVVMRPWNVQEPA